MVQRWYLISKFGCSISDLLNYTLYLNILTKLTSNLITSQIFKSYFKRKIIFWFIIFILVFSYRYNEDHFINWHIVLIMFSLYLFVVFVSGFSDYWFYEKRLSAIILELLNKAPLKDFKDQGFQLEEENKLVGYINEFKVILSPSATSEGGKYLTILIPIEIKEGLEKYFAKFDDLFNITLTDQILFAQAIIKNFNKDYDFTKLYNTIQNTTELLKNRGIKPLKIVDN